MKDFGSDDLSQRDAGEDEGQQGSGATGLFESLAGGSPAPAEPVPLYPEPAVPEALKAALPNVHEVVFHAPGSGGSGLTDPLHRILQSSPPPQSALAGAAPAAATAGGTPRLEANDAFTQMLRALGAKQGPPAVAAEPPRSNTPFRSPVEAIQPSGAGESSSPPAGGGGFTALFRTIQAEQAPMPSGPEPVPAGPSHAAMTQTATGAAESAAAGSRTGSFTQMFAALGPSPAPPAPASVAPAAALPPAPPVAPAGGFTQLFQALESKPAVPAVGGSSFPAPSAPVFSAQAPTNSAQPAGGITQLLRAIDMGSLQEPVVAPVPPRAVAPSAPSTPIAAAGSSYDNERGPSSPTPPFEATSLHAPPVRQDFGVAGAGDSSSLTAMFQTGSSSRPSTVVPVAQPAAASSPVLSSTAPVPMPVPAPTGFAGGAEAREGPGGGSFTQLFQALDRASAPPAAAARPALPAYSAAPAPSAPPPPAQGPGSFTQLFSSSSLRSPQEASQADAFPPIAPPSSAQGGYPGQVGGSGLGSAPGSYGVEAAYREPLYQEPVQSSPAPGGGSLSGGSLTQLLWTLDSGGPPPPAARPPAAALPVTPGWAQDSGQGSPGAGATVAFRLPQQQGPLGAGPAAPPQSATPSGPGEFTRILQASAFRESSMPAPSGGVAPPAPPAAAAPPVAAPQMPGGFPPLPAWHMPPVPAAGAGGGFAMPGVPLPPLPAAPTPPAMPAPPKSSALVPILLVVLIVLVVALLLAVVLLMKH
jgi:hypothetical protein